MMVAVMCLSVCVCEGVEKSKTPSPNQPLLAEETTTHALYVCECVCMYLCGTIREIILSS